MSGISLATLLLCAVALLPVLLVSRIIATEARRRRSRMREQQTLQLNDLHPDVLVDTAESAASARPVHQQFGRAARPVDRSLRVADRHRRTDVVPGAFSQSAFEYTIKRHVGAVRQQAADMGGFAQVPLLLHDRMGNSFTVHRRLCLN